MRIMAVWDTSQARLPRRPYKAHLILKCQKTPWTRYTSAFKICGRRYTLALYLRRRQLRSPSSDEAMVRLTLLCALKGARHAIARMHFQGQDLPTTTRSTDKSMQTYKSLPSCLQRAQSIQTVQMPQPHLISQSMLQHVACKTPTSTTVCAKRCQMQEWLKMILLEISRPASDQSTSPTSMPLSRQMEHFNRPRRTAVGIEWASNVR